MIELICEIFEAYGYSRVDGDVGGVLFFSGEKAIGNEYWLVINFDELQKVVEQQSKLFQLCKDSVTDPSLDKNLSMLVLWETGGAMDVSRLKREVMRVEEDTYFFKKNVLYHSAHEMGSLINVIGDIPLYEFLDSNIANQSVFLEYKKNPLSQEWCPLLYRIAIKIPFLDIRIGSSGGLDSLFELNAERINEVGDKDLVNLEEGFFEINLAEDISGQDYLDSVQSVLKESNDGN